MPITPIGNVGVGPKGVQGDASAKGQFEAFLKLDGIEGESPREGHTNEIMLETFSWGGSNAGSFASGPGGGAGTAQFNDFVATALADKSTPKLFQAMATGQHIAKAVLTVRKAGGSALEFMKWTMSDVLVSGFNAGANGVLPTVEFHLNFAELVMEHQPQDNKGGSAGTIKAGFNLQTGKKT